MATFLGIDCGTQSTKVVIYDPDKRAIVAEGRAPHELLTDAAGKNEQEAAWWVAALKSAMAQLPWEVRQSVAAIGVSGQQHGFVPLDADGEVLTTVKLWCDTTTTAECDALTQAYGGEAKLLDEVGNLILPGYTASKILWLKHGHPDLYARLATILLPHDYLNYVLTDHLVMEYGDASGTGLLDIRKRVWHSDIIRALDPDRDLAACLPNLIGPAQPAGFLTGQAAADLGLPQGILVSSGGGDNMMGAIGTGTNADGSMTMSLGTSGTLYGYSDRPIIDPQGYLAAFCSSTGGWLPLLCTMNCTVATEQLRGIFGLDLDQMEALADNTQPGADGITVLPFFNGERVPNLPHAKASFMGLDTTNFKPGNLVRAAMESALFGLKLGLEAFTALDFKPTELKLTGGGAQSAVWRQMAADIFKLPVLSPVIDETAAFGAALQALWAYRHHEGDKIALNTVLAEHVTCDESRRHFPKGETTAEYDVIYRRYREVLATVQPLLS